MDGKDWSRWSEGAAFGLEQGMAVIPYALLKSYRKLHLTGSEAMLLIHLLSFRQVEGMDFPTLEDLQEVTGRSVPVIAGELRKLIQEGFLSIEGDSDEERGVHYERYNFSGLYAKLGRHLAGLASEGGSAERATAGRSEEGVRAASPGSGWTGSGGRPAPASGNATSAGQASEAPGQEESKSLFAIFEKEFGRPLSPMECETISGWLDQDRYAEELILLALKESVFAGKVHFRYIDRILLEWNRNRVKTAQDVKAYAQKFRGR